MSLICYLVGLTLVQMTGLMPKEITSLVDMAPLLFYAIPLWTPPHIGWSVTSNISKKCEKALKFPEIYIKKGKYGMAR